jgi:hypothetical protein
MRIILCILLISLFGCGKNPMFKDLIGLDKVHEKTIDNSYKIDDLEEQLILLNELVYLQDKRITLIELEFIQVHDSIDNVISNSLFLLESQIKDTNRVVSTIEYEIDILYGLIDDIPTGQVEIVELCKVPKKYSEKILRLSDGILVGYMPKGNEGFLTTLENGSYRTTDGYNCRFNIVNGEVILK